MAVGYGGQTDTGKDYGTDQPYGGRQFWGLQAAGAGTVGVAHRLGTRLSSLLCNRRKELVLLVSGGDKKRQSADIELALEYLRDYKERSQRT